MNGIEDVTIIMPTRNNIPYLELALNSIRNQKEYDCCRLIIFADECKKETENFLIKNKKKYNFEYITNGGGERWGIVLGVQKLIDLVETDIVFYIHDDMVFGKKTIENLRKHLKPKTILTATRIEPPIHPPEKCKITKDFGKFPEDFDVDGFNEFVKKTQAALKDYKTNGIFAPNMFYKSDWIGYDKDFVPQSREDDDVYFTMKTKGYNFIQSWDSLVYHFTCRGSRYKDKELKDSDEWKASNYKNTKNFIRKWHSPPIHDENKHPIIAPDIKITLSVLMKNEGERVYDFLEEVEPYFDEIIVADDFSTDNSIQEIERYIKNTLEKSPTNFKKDKIKIFKRSLNMDFANQTNFITDNSSNNWIMKIDVDETVDSRSLTNIRFLINSVLKENKDIKVIGVPRINTLNEVLVNDIPRNSWVKEYLDTQPKFVAGGELNLKNLDYQFRIFRKDVRWVNPVHEVPEPVKNQEASSVIISSDIVIFHPKTIEKQNQQNTFYNKITNKRSEPVKNINFNSVIYTLEGITKHAREEAKELKNLGYNIFLTTGNFQSGIDKEMKGMYDVFDLNEPHINYINQPPIRETNPFFSVLGNLWRQNVVAYLSFEGVPPKPWVEVLNHPAVRMIFVPSNYVKECFIKGGITDASKIKVIPHGINPEQIQNIKPYEFKDDKFRFLWCGTTHNNRKGYDLAIRAFLDEFEGNNMVQLILKVNKVYDPQQNINNLIKKFLNGRKTDNIKIIDEDLNDEEMYSLIKGVNVLLHPHRSEGFGIIMLEALALGTPLIATRASGNLDFCNNENTHFVEVKNKLAWAPFVFPYDKTEWYQPKIESLKEQMRYVYENYDSVKLKQKTEAEIILSKWTWENTAKLMDEEFKKL